MRIVMLLGLALSGVLTTGHARAQQMTTDTKTQCLGRYLIDLPADAQVRVSYAFARGDVRTHRNVTTNQFEQRLAEREAELKQASHRQGGEMFVGRTDLGNGRVVLTSWSSPSSRYLYQYERFIHVAPENMLYVLSGQGDADKSAGSLEYSRSLAETVRFRAPTEIPDEPGFCIDSGLIQRSKFNREEVTANIRLREYPSVTLTFMSYVTGNPDRELLRRTSTIPPGYEEVAARMQTLRRGNRNLDQVKGQELLVRGDGEGKKAYEFLWESQGQANSLEYPFLSLQLSTTGEIDEEGEVIDAPFESNEEAMALWDTILGSLRLRPGAVGR